jgi:hypothetical protein
MNILGIDPGATSGWCLYDTQHRRAVASGEFPHFNFNDTPIYHVAHERACETIVIERPRGYGPTRPQLVDCGYVCGRLIERMESVLCADVEELVRLDVCKILTAAVHDAIRVRNDATAWAALLLLHGGEGAAKKAKVKKGVTVEPAGSLGIVTGHARAALAVAVAWSLRQEVGHAHQA